MTDLADTTSADSKDSPEATAAQNASEASSPPTETPLEAATPADAVAAKSTDGANGVAETSGEPGAESAADAQAKEATESNETDSKAASDSTEAEAKNEAPSDGDVQNVEAAPVAEAATGEEKSSEPDKPETAPEPEEMKPEIVPLVAAMEAKEALKGTVIGWNKGGFHINLNGVTAFCPKSQIERGNPKKAGNYLNRELEFRVIEIKENGKRVVVSRSELLAEQRDKTLTELREKMKSGDPIKGKVTSITDFGAFVDLGGIEGLIHLSALSRRRVDNPREILQSGEEVEVKVTKIEKGGERISLSRKALEPDPWKGAEERFEVGEKYSGKILRKADFGFFVELEPGLEGLVHTSQLPHGTSPDDDAVAVGNTIDVWVRDADSGRRRLALSMREVAKGNFKELISKYEEGQEIDGTVEQVARFGLFVQLEPGLTGLMPFSAMPGQGSGPMGQRTHRPGQEMKVLISEIDSKRKRISLAPVGSQLAGTKSDLKNYQQKQDKSEGGMGAMAAAFAKLQKNG